MNKEIPREAALDVDGAMREILVFAGEHHGWFGANREPLFEEGKGLSVLWIEKLTDTMRRLYASGQADREDAILADPELFHLRNERP